MEVIATEPAGLFWCALFGVRGVKLDDWFKFGLQKWLLTGPSKGH